MTRPRSVCRAGHSGLVRLSRKETPVTRRDTPVSAEGTMAPPSSVACTVSSMSSEMLSQFSARLHGMAWLLLQKPWGRKMVTFCRRRVGHRLFRFIEPGPTIEPLGGTGLGEHFRERRFSATMFSGSSGNTSNSVGNPPGTTARSPPLWCASIQNMLG